MLSTYWALACLAVSAALLLRLERRDAAGIPWPHRLACPLRALTTLEYVLIAIVLFATVYTGVSNFGGAVETAFNDLSNWVSDATSDLPTTTTPAATPVPTPG